MSFNARIYSHLGQSGAVFGITINNLFKELPLKVVSADMSVVAGLERFKKTSPEDFYNIGIAEQNMLGVAAGLADEGYRTVAVAQACFVTMRSFEQVRQYMGYMQIPIVLVGINSGFTLTYFGNTHYALEDLGLMRGIPNLIVLSPADAWEAAKCFEWAMYANKPTYIRLFGGLNIPMVYKEDFDFKVDKLSVVRDGDDIVIFATGSMVANALKVAEILSERGVSLRVINVHTIVPLDKQGIKNNLIGKIVFTLEEHNIVGGLGTAISECIAEGGVGVRLVRLGVRTGFMKQIGGYEWLLEQNRLTPAQIAEDICRYV